jgi:hypothetical protein
MDPKETTAAVNDNFFEVPEGIRLARAAFIRDFPALIANRRTRGKYVCYHNDVCVAVTNNYVDMIDEVNRKTYLKTLP